MGQMELNRLASAQAEGIRAGKARADLVAGLAKCVPAPAKQTCGLALPELELVESVGHEAAPFRSRQRLGRFNQQVAQPCCDFHGSASLTEQGRYSTINASLCGPVIFFRPPKDVDPEHKASSACERPTRPSQGGPRRIQRWWVFSL